MINFKRIFAGVMAAATAVSLAACSNSGTSTTAPDDSNTSTETTIDDEIDNPYGLDETTGQIVKDILGNTLFDIQSDYSGQSWTQMREANIGSISKQIEYYNGLLAR